MSSENALYADLSNFYDQFCADIDYGQHIEFSQRVHQCFGHSENKTYLDLACGTGQLLGPMEAAGYEVSGLDYSANMLRVAQKRCESATLIHSDMAHLNEKLRYGLITCFLYSLHYSYPMSSLVRTLQQVYKALKPAGVFVFDTVDKAGIREKDVVSTYPVEEGNLTFRSGWRYPGKGDTMTLQINILREDKKGTQIWEDQHTMTASHIRELCQIMADIGFEVTPLEHDFSTLRPWDETSFNALIVGVKAV